MAEQLLPPLVDPGGNGTSWGCGVEDELKQIANRSYLKYAALLKKGAVLDILGTAMILLVLLLAAINLFIPLPLIRLLLLVVAGIAALINANARAANCYDAAAEYKEISNIIRVELLMPVGERINGLYFLRSIQIAEGAVESDFLRGNLTSN